jgi:hypothetical protein
VPLINRAEIFHLLATRTILPRLALSPLLHVPRAKLEALTEVWWDYEKEWPAEVRMDMVDTTCPRSA